MRSAFLPSNAFREGLSNELETKEAVPGSEAVGVLIRTLPLRTMAFPDPQKKAIFWPVNPEDPHKKPYLPFPNSFIVAAAIAARSSGVFLM